MTDGRRAAGSTPQTSVDHRSTGIDVLTARFAPGRRAVVCYVPLGDPLLPPQTMLDAYADAGVDVLEVGIPSRDPWLDGPEVSKSMTRALDAGVDAAWVARTLADWRSARDDRGRDTPAILWFGYPELPVDAVRDAAAIRALDAVLLIEPHRCTDAATLDAELARLGVARCAFLPWEPTVEDLGSAAGTTGYVMVQARPGVTGAGGQPADPRPLVRVARETAPGRPVVAGFGVSGPHDVTRVLASGVDGVVVGSACIGALGDGGEVGLRTFLASVVVAARAASGSGA
ncbi:MAG: tryptophan synthase subunit alpha [Chloroflexota bacterium]